MNIFTELGRYILMIKGMFSKPENMKMYWKEFMHQCVEIGIRSLGIVVIISVFMGAVSALQTAYQLVSPLIPLSTIAQIVRDTVILEFSPTLVCIVLAGVVGSKIAGELGNMRVSEQIDALEIMGINTKTYLILPKILGALLTIPMLVIISAVLGILGGNWLRWQPVLFQPHNLIRDFFNILNHIMCSLRWQNHTLLLLLFPAYLPFMVIM